MNTENKQSEARYRGEKTRHGVRVWADDEPLQFPITDATFRPCEFDWGYAGRGPGALAYAILAHHLKDPIRALHLHGDFMRSVVARLPRDSQWRLRGEDVEDWLSRSGSTRALGESAVERKTSKTA